MDIYAFEGERCGNLWPMCWPLVSKELVQKCSSGAALASEDYAEPHFPANKVPKETRIRVPNSQ